MSTVSSSTMASELLLNKIMNGQVKTDKTVTAGLRASSNALAREAIEPALESAEVKKSEASVIDYQDKVTELVNYLKNTDQALAGADDATAQTIRDDAQAFLTSIAAQTFTNTPTSGTPTQVTPFGATSAGFAISLGNGQTMEVGENQDAADALADVIGSTATTADAVRTEIQAALDLYNSELARTGLQVQTIQGRSALLDDLAATYSDASSQQYAVTTADVTNLLNNVIS